MSDDRFIDLDEEEAHAEEATDRQAPSEERPAETKKRKRSKKDKEKEKEALRIVDRRFWARPAPGGGKGNGGEEAAEETSALAPTYVEELQEEIARLKEDVGKRDEKLRQTVEAYQTLKEETEKFRGRVERDSERRLAQAKGDFLKDLLAVLDSFDRALDALPEDSAEAGAYREGLQMIGEQFARFMKAAGLERFAPDGEPFDPATSEAMEVVPVESNEEHNLVLETLSAGYRLGDMLLRPAQVRVGKKSG
jgi:molecular chaperone GrpE